MGGYACVTDAHPIMLLGVPYIPPSPGIFSGGVYAESGAPGTMRSAFDTV